MPRLQQQLGTPRRPAAENRIPPPRSIDAGTRAANAVHWVLNNQCLDEDLHGTGTSFISAHAVTTPTQTRTNSHARVADDWQLEGLTTHQIWRQVPGGHNEAVQTASGDFLIVEERFVFQNQTTAVVLDWPARITFVTSADGEVKVDRFVFDPCPLRH